MLFKLIERLAVHQSIECLMSADLMYYRCDVSSPQYTITAMCHVCNMDSNCRTIKSTETAVVYLLPDMMKLVDPKAIPAVI